MKKESPLKYNPSKFHVLSLYSPISTSSYWMLPFHHTQQELIHKLHLLLSIVNTHSELEGALLIQIPEYECHSWSLSNEKEFKKKKQKVFPEVRRGDVLLLYDLQNAIHQKQIAYFIKTPPSSLSELLVSIHKIHLDRETIEENVGLAQGGLNSFIMCRKYAQAMAYSRQSMYITVQKAYIEGQLQLLELEEERLKIIRLLDEERMNLETLLVEEHRKCDLEHLYCKYLTHPVLRWKRIILGRKPKTFDEFYVSKKK